MSENCLQPVLQEMLAEMSDDPAAQERLAWDYASHPEAMMDVLSYLDTQYGGAQEYLLAAGVTQQELGRVRHRLLA